MSDVTKSTCRLSWKPPKVDGGARITSYQIERQEVGKPYWVTVSSHCKVGTGDGEVEGKGDDVTCGILQTTGSALGNWGEWGGRDIEDEYDDMMYGVFTLRGKWGGGGWD